ncbi:MAG TPA: AraC family transcriptional regulator [Conexibacter sp.]|jgi:AraC-like DNA-binding protein
MAPDPLSAALALVNARCVVSGIFSVGGAWALRFHPPARLKLAVVARGCCWLALEDNPGPVWLEEGDVAVSNGPHGLVVASDLSVEPSDGMKLYEESATPFVSVGDSEEVKIICGHVQLNESGDELLLAALPHLTHIRAGAEASAVRWPLDRLLDEAASLRPGSSFATDQHAQLLLVEVLRACITDVDSFPPGWLRALADERIAPALRLMHADPARPWRLDELARAAAMSRTAFAAHFKEAAGIPPLAYLHRWRMRVAERALRDDDVPIATLAYSLGYNSESAFSTAFKRTAGVSPRRYREAERAGVEKGDAAAAEPAAV